MRQKCLPIMVLSHLNSPLLLRCHQNSGTMYMITDRGDFDRLRSSFQAANLSNAISFLAGVTDYIPVKKLKGRSPVPWIKRTYINPDNERNSYHLHQADQRLSLRTCVSRSNAYCARVVTHSSRKWSCNQSAIQNVFGRHSH